MPHPRVGRPSHHLSSINPSPSVNSTPGVFKAPSAPHPALTPPATTVENEVESPLSLCDSSTASSPSSASSVASSASYILQPRFPITYNKTALSQLHGRQQVRILKNLSIPLPSTSSNDGSEADISAKVQADSPCQNRK